MKITIKFYFFICLFFCSCVSKKNLEYIQLGKKNLISIIDKKNINNFIQAGDILSIDVKSESPELTLPYNSENINFQNTSLDLLILKGYLVSDSLTIDFPILGKIKVDNCSAEQLELKISNSLVEEGHLISPHVKVRKVNLKFTVLGEVRNPGTFNYYDENLNLFQALGYAGDLTIDGSRDDLTLVREIDGLRKSIKLDLTDAKILKNNFYNIKNNDVIIVNPNYSKTKSAGFIGSPASIASISSILLSVTLLLINNNN